MNNLDSENIKRCMRNPIKNMIMKSSNSLLNNK